MSTKKEECLDLMVQNYCDYYSQLSKTELKEHNLFTQKIQTEGFTYEWWLKESKQKRSVASYNDYKNFFDGIYKPFFEGRFSEMDRDILEKCIQGNKNKSK